MQFGKVCWRKQTISWTIYDFGGFSPISKTSDRENSFLSNFVWLLKIKYACICYIIGYFT